MPRSSSIAASRSRCLSVALWLVGILSLAPVALTAAGAQGPLRILSVTPRGEDVPTGRQVVLQFDRPVVPTWYTVLIRPGLVARDGATLAETASQRFLTRRPKISGVRFETWRAPGFPQLIIG